MTPPNSTENRSSEIEYRMIFDWNTKRMPTARDSQIDSFASASLSCAGRGLIRAYIRPCSSIRAQTATRLVDRPTAAYRKPPVTGPRIAPACHSVLLQAVALA